MAIKAQSTGKKGTAVKTGTAAKTVPAKKAPAKQTAATASAGRTGSTAGPAKYDQPGAPWWKKLPLPTPK